MKPLTTQHTKAEYSLTFNQVISIINKADSLRDKCMLECMYYGGMRVDEVVSLKISYIHFENKFIDVFGKGKKIRTIPFLDMGFYTDLQFHIGTRKDGYVFLYNNKQITRRTAQYISQKAGERAEIKHPDPLAKHINPHLFRHSVANHLKMLEYSTDFIQKFLGHSDPKITMNMYGKLSIQQMQQIVVRKSKNIQLLGDFNKIKELE